MEICFHFVARVVPQMNGERAQLLVSVIYGCSRSAISIQDDVFIVCVNEPSNKQTRTFSVLIKTKVFKSKLQKLAFLVESLVFSC